MMLASWAWAPSLRNLDKRARTRSSSICRRPFWKRWMKPCIPSLAHTKDDLAARQDSFTLLRPCAMESVSPMPVELSNRSTLCELQPEQGKQHWARAGQHPSPKWRESHTTSCTDGVFHPLLGNNHCPSFTPAPHPSSPSGPNHSGHFGTHPLLSFPSQPITQPTLCKTKLSK